MNKYKINVVNKSTSEKTFWCFLDNPIPSVSGEVFANSSAFQSIPVHKSGLSNSFTIPIQYSVQAGAMNKAVGVDIEVDAQQKENVDLKDLWQASYFPGSHGTPTLNKVDNSAASDEVNVQTNNYDKSKEESAGWYGNMTFGVESEQGFIGVTWSPDPGMTYYIEPQITFYISVGSFSSNKLAKIDAVSHPAATITQDSFDNSLECTVTLNNSGKWHVTAGPPSNASAVAAADAYMLDSLVDAHVNLSQAHVNLIDLVGNAVDTTAVLSIDNNTIVADAIETSVASSKKVLITNDAVDDFGIITGTITVGAAIGVGFLYMFASGITVEISKRNGNGTEFSFTYNGQAAKQAILDAFQAGKEILFIR